MYYPYFRGKQFDLITIRECASVMANSGFIPIIEPVRTSISGLEKTLISLHDEECESILIINPKCGEQTNDPTAIRKLLNDHRFSNVRIGYILDENTHLDSLSNMMMDFRGRYFSIIHSGYPNPADVVSCLARHPHTVEHIFLSERCGKLYQKHFRGFHRVVIKDNFHKRSNKDHPDVEFFSDIHATYQEEGVDGFGDFLIVGDDYSESGGPAYAVAIHVTYIGDDESMYVFHFKSDSNYSPTDPAGKFSEALDKLFAEVNNPSSKLKRTPALEEFLHLHRIQHFPGLGSVKKISMKHHIQTLADYLG